jgi:type IV pilus assembly protein PilM
MGSMLTTAGILSAASAILIAAVTGFLALRANAIDDQTAKVQEDIDKLQAQVEANKVLHNRLEIINRYKNYVETVQLDIDSMPILRQDKFDKIEEVLEKDEAKYESITFDLKEGSFTISKVEVNTQEDVKKVVDDLLALDFVAYVDYAGYSGTGEDDEKVNINNLKLYFEREGV